MSVPPQNYPPQGYPQNYPPQGYPPQAQGYPPQAQGYTPQGYTPQGYQQPGFAQPGVAPQGFNPYAAPQAQPGAFGYGAPTQMAGGIWRAGNILVMHKMAQLPDICVKSGQKATGRLRRNLRWYPPWINVMIIVAWLVYIILVSVMSKRASIDIGLCDEWFQKRKIRLMISWVVGLFGVGLIGLFMLLGTRDGASPIWALLLMMGFILMLGALIGGQYSCRLVHPHKIDDMYVYLKGVHPSVLAMYPEWQYPI